MDKILRRIGVFLLVHRAVRAHEVSRLGIGEHVLHDRLIAPVYVFLSGLADIYVAEARRSPLHGIKHIEYEGILPVIIPAPLRESRLVLRGKQHLVVYILAVMEHHPAVHGFLVVPVHHHGLVVRVNGVIVYIFGYVHRAPAQLAVKLRICLYQQIVVRKLHMEHIAGFLYVGDSALPKEVDKVYLAY